MWCSTTIWNKHPPSRSLPSEPPSSPPFPLPDATDAPSNERAPLPSSSAFDHLACSEAGMAGEARFASTAIPWTKVEDEGLLQGMRERLGMPQTLRKFKICRTASAARSRRIALLKKSSTCLFSESPTPKSSQRDNNTPPSSARPRPWSEDDIWRMRRAIADGYELSEVHLARFRQRSEEAVREKFLELEAGVLRCEQSKADYPHEANLAASWSPRRNLKLRRVWRERIPLSDAHKRWFASLDLELLRQKFNAYDEQMRTLQGQSLKSPPGIAHPHDSDNEDLRANGNYPTDPFEDDSVSQGGWMEIEDSQSTGSVDKVPPPKSSPPVNLPSGLRSSPAVVIPVAEQRKAVRRPLLKKHRDGGGQTRLNFPREKGKEVNRPTRESNAQLDETYQRKDPSSKSREDRSAAQKRIYISSSDNHNGGASGKGDHVNHRENQSHLANDTLHQPHRRAIKRRRYTPSEADVAALRPTTRNSAQSSPRAVRFTMGNANTLFELSSRNLQSRGSVQSSRHSSPSTIDSYDFRPSVQLSQELDSYTASAEAANLTKSKVTQGGVSAIPSLPDEEVQVSRSVPVESHPHLVRLDSVSRVQDTYQDDAVGSTETSEAEEESQAFQTQKLGDEHSQGPETTKAQGLREKSCCILGHKDVRPEHSPGQLEREVSVEVPATPSKSQFTSLPRSMTGSTSHPDSELEQSVDPHISNCQMIENGACSPSRGSNTSPQVRQTSLASRTDTDGSGSSSGRRAQAGRLPQNLVPRSRAAQVLRMKKSAQTQRSPDPVTRHQSQWQSRGPVPSQVQPSATDTGQSRTEKPRDTMTPETSDSGTSRSGSPSFIRPDEEVLAAARARAAEQDDVWEIFTDMKHNDLWLTAYARGEFDEVLRLKRIQRSRNYDRAAARGEVPPRPIRPKRVLAPGEEAAEEEIERDQDDEYLLFSDDGGLDFEHGSESSEESNDEDRKTAAVDYRRHFSEVEDDVGSTEQRMIEDYVPSSDGSTSQYHIRQTTRTDDSSVLTCGVLPREASSSETSPPAALSQISVKPQTSGLSALAQQTPQNPSVSPTLVQNSGRIPGTAADVDTKVDFNKKAGRARATLSANRQALERQRRPQQRHDDARSPPSELVPNGEGKNTGAQGSICDTRVPPKPHGPKSKRARRRSRARTAAGRGSESANNSNEITGSVIESIEKARVTPIGETQSTESSTRSKAPPTTALPRGTKTSLRSMMTTQGSIPVPKGSGQHKKAPMVLHAADQDDESEAESIE